MPPLLLLQSAINCDVYLGNIKTGIGSDINRSKRAQVTQVAKLISQQQQQNESVCYLREKSRHRVRTHQLSWFNQRQQQLTTGDERNDMQKEEEVNGRASLPFPSLFGTITVFCNGSTQHSTRRGSPSSSSLPGGLHHHHHLIVICHSLQAPLNLSPSSSSSFEMRFCTHLLSRLCALRSNQTRPAPYGATSSIAWTIQLYRVAATALAVAKTWDSSFLQTLV